jgi:hypothetical protein
MASGDILYVAPGNYNESVTIGFAPSAATQIIGDPNSQFFGGVTAGPVLISAFNAAGTSETVTSTLIIAASRSYFEWSNIYFKVSTGRAVSATNARYWKFTNCVLDCNTRASPVGVINLSSASGVALDATITRCRFAGGRYLLLLTGQNVSDTTSVTSSVFESSEEGIDINNLQVSVTNCSFISCDWAIYQRSGSVSFPSSVRNCLFLRCTQVQVTTTGQLTENFNRWTTATRNNIGTLGANSTTGGDGGIDSGYLLQTNGNYLQTYTPNLSSPNIAFGTATSSPATDLYGVTWSGASPDAGGITYRVITSLPSLVAYNGGIERNASAITIAPASTSQSVELYLGATGLTFATSGLAAYYVRNQAAPVAITLVTQTPTGAWTSGGFAEISSSLVPGVYRLDVPDAAFAAGASDVTIVVRGASGTNGAVLTVTLSSGGLTAAQTAAAVLDAVASIHNNAGSIGASIQDKAGYSLSTPQSFSTTGSVGSVTGNVAGNVTGTVGGVVGNVTGNIAGSVATVASPDNIIDGVWDEQRTGHTAAGSFGEKLQTNALADEMLARDLGSGLNAGTAEERTVRSALRALRNKVNVGSSQMVVKKEDDTTDAWTATVTTTAVSSNVSGIDPN